MPWALLFPTSCASSRAEPPSFVGVFAPWAGKKRAYLTWVRRQCLDAFAMGSVTCVQAAPNSITFGGPLCIMSKNAFTPTAALHCNRRDKSYNKGGVSLLGASECVWKQTSD